MNIFIVPTIFSLEAENALEYACGIRRILFACDYPREVPQNILTRIREMASAPDDEVEIFHAQAKVDKMSHNDNILHSSNTVEEGLQGITYYYKEVESGAVFNEIEKEVKILDADLLIMMLKKYGFWHSLIHRSKTGIMASNNDVPLLSDPLYFQKRLNSIHDHH